MICDKIETAKKLIAKFKQSTKHLMNCYRIETVEQSNSCYNVTKVKQSDSDNKIETVEQSFDEMS